MRGIRCCGERLRALSFRRRQGVLRLVVVLPDGTPGMVAADATDVFGDAGTSASRLPTILSVDGVRRLRSRLARDAEAASPSSVSSVTTCGRFRPEWARLTSLVPRQRDQEVSRARTQNSGGDTVAAAVGAGVCRGRWEQLPERTRAQVLTLLARMIARGVLVEDGTDG